jgi:hypothetical protein
MTQSAFFFSPMCKLDDGRKIPTDIEGTCRKVVDGIFSNHADGIGRFLFVPMKDERRFRIADIRIPSDWNPLHALDVCEGRGVFMELRDEDCELLDRADGLAAVSEKNREIMQDEYESSEWWVLIELGEPLPMPLVAIDIDEAGAIGCETRWIKFPVRVVAPTPDEVKDWA